MKSQGTPNTSVDVNQINLADVEQSAFPSDVESEYRVVIEKAAYQNIRDHANVDTSVELGGVLAGQLMKDSDGPFLLVKHALRGVATKRTSSQVTFTHETWEQIHDEMEQKYPDLHIVGWYHTHPGFGIFLSEMDEFIQDHFFNLPHQVAFVFDPLSDENGLFMWRNGRSVRQRRYWLEGMVHYDLESNEPPSFDKTPRLTPSAETMPEGASRQPMLVEQQAPFSNLFWVGMGVLTLMLAFWLGATATRVAGVQSMEQAKGIENLIRTGLFRDDLGKRLASLNRDLNQINKALQTALTAGNQQDAVSSRKSLDEACRLVLATNKHLAEIGSAYTQADRLADRMGRISGFGDDLLMVSSEIQGHRLVLATLCRAQASTLENTGGDDELKMARNLRLLAAQLMPEEKPEKKSFWKFLDRFSSAGES